MNVEPREIHENIYNQHDRNSEAWLRCATQKPTQNTLLSKHTYSIRLTEADYFLKHNLLLNIRMGIIEPFNVLCCCRHLFFFCSRNKSYYCVREGIICVAASPVVNQQEEKCSRACSMLCVML